MKEYIWRTGFSYKLDANEVGKELEKLDEITPKNVVDLARDEKNMLHDIFEWDDTIAAEKYRTAQASKLITNLQIKVISKDDEKPKKIAAFVTMKRQTFYEPIETIIKDTSRYALLLEKAYRELNNIKSRYEELSEIQELLKDIPEVE